MTLSRALLLKSVFVTALGMSLPAAAAAQTDAPKDTPDDAPRAYVSAAIEAIELESFAGDPTFTLFGESTTTALVRGGVVVHRYFAVEGEAALGISNSSDDGIADYESRFGAYGRARVPFGETGFEIFARAGYAVTNIDSRNVIGGDGDGLNGITYGGGAAFNFGTVDQFQIRIDYTEYNFGNSQDADAFSVGVGYNF